VQAAPGPHEHAATSTQKILFMHVVASAAHLSSFYTALHPACLHVVPCCVLQLQVREFRA
jgi:hypothetical protein